MLFAENNLKWFFEELSKLVLNALDYRLFFGSKKLSAGQYELLIKEFDLGLLDNDEILTDNLAALLLRPDFKLNVEFPLLLGLFSNLKNASTKKRLLIKYLNDLSEVNVGLLLNWIDHDFAELTLYKRPKFDDDENELNKTLLHLLREKEYFVSSIQPPKNNKFVVYTKQKPGRK